MKLLFIHQNFPGQYLHLVQRLRSGGDAEILGLGEKENILRRGTIYGITTIGYPKPQGAGKDTHHYLQSTEAAVRRGQAVVRSLLELRDKGFTPDVISVHPGWGEGLFVRDVFPRTPILMFCEYFFNAAEADLNFDPEFPYSLDWNFSVRVRNTPQLLSLPTANALVSPTAWQISRYPSILRREIQQIHDGIDVDYMCPDYAATLTLQPQETPGESRLADEGPLTLRRGDKVVTYVVRNIEPYRGAHIFLRALPELQRRHPGAHVLIVGEDGASYSPALPEGQTYKAKFLEELRGRLDLSRVHFLGRIPYAALRNVFRVSAAHVYLTYPFVLSWSALEAMACGCLLVASRTEPVQEVITHGRNGLLVDFFESNALADTLDAALSRPRDFDGLRASARETIVSRYALDACLERQIALLHDLAAGRYSREL